MYFDNKALFYSNQCSDDFFYRIIEFWSELVQEWLGTISRKVVTWTNAD